MIAPRVVITIEEEALTVSQEWLDLHSDVLTDHDYVVETILPCDYFSPELTIERILELLRSNPWENEFAENYPEPF